MIDTPVAQAVLVDGGNFDICVPTLGAPEWLSHPGGLLLPARVTENARWCFELAVREVRRLRTHGVDAKLGGCDS